MGNLKSKITHFFKVLKGEVSFIQVEVNRPKKWYGSSYGGFYIDPTLVPEDAIVYSFGIGQDISFDEAIITSHQAHVFGFDPTPKSIEWIEKQSLPDGFTFLPFGLGEKTGHVRFNLPKYDDHVSGSIHQHRMVNADNSIEVLLKSFQDIIHENGHQYIDVLKMDIEGSEFAVMESVLHSGIPIKQILVETHSNFFTDGKDKGKVFFSMLAKNGYRIFGISNTYQEVSLVKI